LERPVSRSTAAIERVGEVGYSINCPGQNIDKVFFSNYLTTMNEFV
jgi:hypothetical protein